MKRALFFCCCLILFSALGWSDSPRNQIVDIRSSVSKGQVRCVIELEREPLYSVYALRRSDRLVINLLDCQPYRGALGASPGHKAIRGWKMEQASLSRQKLVISLGARLPADRWEAKAFDSPPRIVLDFKPDYSFKRDLALTQGVSWRLWERFEKGSYLRWSELFWEAGERGVSIGAELANNDVKSRGKLSEMVAKNGALAGINGGFFAGAGGPLGVVVRQGEIRAPHVGRRPARSVLGIDHQGRWLIDRVKVVKGRLLTLGGAPWNNIQEAIGGGPQLIKDGKLALTTKAEELGPGGNDITRVAGRTAIGFGKRVHLVCASGYRDNHREGLTLGTLSRLLLSRGVRQAVNMDGGASVDMVIGGTIVSDGPGNASREKPVASAWMVYDDRQRLYPEKIVCEEGDAYYLPADGSSRYQLSLKVLTPEGKKVADGTWVRAFPYRLSVEPSVAKVKDGKVDFVVTPSRMMGISRLRLESGFASKEISYWLQAGSPERILVRKTVSQVKRAKKGEEEPEVEEYTVLTLECSDEFGNPIPKRSFFGNPYGKSEVLGVSDQRGVLKWKGLKKKVSPEMKVWTDGLDAVRVGK